MPSGKVHYSYWKEAIPVIGIISVVSAVTSKDLLLGSSVMLGYLFGRYIDPDLDQIGITEAEGRLIKDLKLFGVFIVAYWLPYGYIMKHRSFLSHFPVVSTFIRIIYMFLPVIVLLALRPDLLSYSPILFPFLSGIFGGLAISDLIHYMLDTIK